MATTMATDALKKRFETEGFEVREDVVAVALADVARERSWSEDDLVKMWDLFDANALAVGEELEMRHVVRIEWLEKFEAFARDAAEAKRKTEAASASKRTFGKKRRHGRASEGGMTPGKSPRTPGSVSSGGSGRASVFANGATPTKTKREWSEALDALTGDEPSEYSKRAATPGSASATGGDGAGNVTLNAHLSAELPAAEDGGECAVETTPGVVAREKFRYMRDTIPDRVRAINARIRDVETRFRVADEDEDEDEAKRVAVDATTTATTTAKETDAPRVSRVGSTTGAEDAHFVGRIVSAVHDSDAKLTEKTVALEGSIEQSCGDRVRLELRDLERYSLFPGQVVQVTGRNPAGHCLVVKSIDAAPAVRPFARSKRSSPAFTRGAKVLVASGPFSCSSDLRYEPLGDFLEYARDEKPDVVVLCGPIVDAENVFVKKGDCNGLTFHEVAALTAANIEARLPENTKVIYAPSVRDATLDAAFPQPAPVVPGDARRAFSVSNPGTFTVNGVVFSVCTHDALKHLSAHEISKGFVAKDRLTRLAGHFARQAHAYPLYPPDASACMDARHADALRLDVSPDVFILPSDLKTFVEDVDGVVCVNPGRLARGGGGGTLAKIVIHPASVEGLDDETEHRVNERARVDIMKIK